MARYIVALIVVLQWEIAYGQEDNTVVAINSIAMDLQQKYTRERWVAVSELEGEINITGEAWINVTFYDAAGESYNEYIKLDKASLTTLSQNQGLKKFFVRVRRDINKGVVILNK